MTVEGMAALEAARGGFLETLGRAPVGFQLGHGLAPFLSPVGTLHLTLHKRPRGALFGSETLLVPREISRGGYFRARSPVFQ